MKLQVGVKAIIKNSSGAMLFLQRSTQLSTDTSEPSWDIPGGRIDAGEPLLEALRREIREEIGHDSKAAPQLINAQDIIIPAKELHVVRLTYIIEEDIPTINLSDEHVAYRWATADEITAMNIEPYLAQTLKGLYPHAR